MKNGQIGENNLPFINGISGFLAQYTPFPTSENIHEIRIEFRFHFESDAIFSSNPYVISYTRTDM